MSNDLDLAPLTIEKWIATVARPEHVESVRALVTQTREHQSNFILATNALRALMRLKQVREMKIEADEIADQVERLVIEEREDDSGRWLSFSIRSTRPC